MILESEERLFGDDWLKFYTDAWSNADEVQDLVIDIKKTLQNSQPYIRANLDGKLVHLTFKNI